MFPASNLFRPASLVIAGKMLMAGCSDDDGSDFAENELKYRTESAEEYCGKNMELEEGTPAYQECFDDVVKYVRSTQLQGV